MEEYKDSRKEEKPREEIDEGYPKEEDGEEYSFIQETIKKEKGAVRRGIFRMAGFGLVFGVFACFSFSALRPVMDKIFQEDPAKLRFLRRKSWKKGRQRSRK